MESRQMHCRHCGFANGEEEHRCLRCGRRIAGIAIAAPARYSGANALALNETQDFPPVERASEQVEPVVPERHVRPSQPTLFIGSDQKVIPFDEIQRHVAARAGAGPRRPAPGLPAGKQTSPRLPRGKKHTGPVAEQGSFELLSADPAPRPRRAEVPKQVECPRTVATPQHRLTASALDGAMMTLGFGLFCSIVELTGCGFGTAKVFWMTLGASFALISLFYGLVWAIAGGETAGMNWTGLQMITFDGLGLDGRTRAVRFGATWLSFCSGGLGLVWALADEESLTWHDHISKTFPTFRELPAQATDQAL